MEHNPSLRQGQLAVKAAGINIKVSDNALLPKLDLTASASAQGMSERIRKSNDQLRNGRYDSYSVGLSLEYPIGNRQAKAQLGRARYQRLKAITELRNNALLVAQNVREQIRQIETTYQEVLAQKEAVAAGVMQLKALDDTEKIRGRLSPEFLQLKLQAQVTLANSQMAHMRAIIDYNTAMTMLTKATGTVLKRYSVEMAKSAPTPND